MCTAFRGHPIIILISLDSITITHTWVHDAMHGLCVLESCESNTPFLTQIEYLHHILIYRFHYS